MLAVKVGEQERQSFRLKNCSLLNVTLQELKVFQVEISSMKLDI